MNLLQFWGAVEIGLIYSLVALGVFLTFKVINFADLTVDGSFPMGAAIVASMVVKSYNPYLALFTCFVFGGVIGVFTSVLNSHFKIMDLLSGILMMTALYSINLRIMGQPNIALFGHDIIFDGDNNILLMSLIVILIFMLVGLLFRTEFGLSMRAIGINSRCAEAQGINLAFYQAITIGLSNGIIALAGGFFALMQGFADISMGTGTIIIGLASVIIGEKLVAKNFFIILTGCILGSIIYRLAITIALNADFLGLESSDLNMLTSLIVIAFLVAPKLFKRRGMRC
jgi:putative ABC transport system permease protein